MSPTDEEPPLLTIDEVAASLNVPKRMARRLIEERRLPAVKVGRYVRVRPADLAAYVEHRTREAVNHNDR